MKVLIKKLLISFLLFLPATLIMAQDSLRPVEPGMETSFDNTELLIIALVGLALLMLLYFYFRRRRRN